MEVEYEGGDEISIGTIWGARIGGRGSKLNIGIATKRRQIEQNNVLRGIGKSWVGFQLAQLTTP